ncbi:UV DNA damage repair endonuclease UvsE [Alkalicella caledoniensis]|uniref:UV DNA damage repair endonuclease UvsE n=1 Tax=Alkalicella caledoniensis TaxID=2731377 RepID=A0A7G9W931_ALKCA|nr:UV DNA damage repair endonuclease UvsE [Alkalicella caledoniensis]QNO15193.1 UV DNA damage repair endonuclease UvsE [Alkalicella caledoniensis]
MEIRLGYVAMSLEVKDCSPSKTITLKSLDKLPDKESQLFHLRKLTETNLNNTLRLLYHNASLGIEVFRLTSKLVPMATHPISQGFDYTNEFNDLFLKIGTYIKEKGFRVSAHPDHFTVLNTPKEDVLSASIKDLQYHHKLFQAMGLPNSSLVLHVGGSYGNKERGLERFAENLDKLPLPLRDRIIVENDDKSYTAEEVLTLCQRVKLPMVLDYHHYLCNKGPFPLEELISDIFKTWKGQIPKVHISSPKNEKHFRHHADFIDVTQFMNFIEIIQGKAANLDIMIEAKAKDTALLKLLSELKKVQGISVGPGAKIKIK